MANSSDFHGRRGIRYFSQFKPTVPTELEDGIVIVPAGWCFVSLAPGSEMKHCVSYFLGPSSWSDEELWRRFRDWVAFDSFVMWTDGSSMFNKNLFQVGHFVYSVHQGTPDDESDLHNSVDYSDIGQYLVREIAKTETTPSVSYFDLYKKYRLLDQSEKELVEWLASPPSSDYFRPHHAFANPHWAILHLVILIEHLVGSPPLCLSKPCECPTCKRTPQGHYSMSRREWLQQELLGRMKDQKIVDSAVAVLGAALSIRNPMSHKPYFDRSVSPHMDFHLQTFEYSAKRSVAEFKVDSNARLALELALRQLAHELVTQEIFGVEHFSAPPLLKVTHIQHSDLGPQ